MTTEKFDSVWDALEPTPEEAENMKIRAQLMSALQQHIAALETTQQEAAKRLKITQPRLNDLLKGKIDKFSLDALVNLISRAGLELSFEVKRAA